MGNHRKKIFWPLTHPNPNCTLCRRNERDTWPHLLSTCEHPYLKGLRIARHNKAVHLITQTLQANKHTRFLTRTNAGHLNNQPQETTVPEWLLACTCPQTPCQCQAKLKPDILCMIGAPNHTTLPITPSSNLYSTIYRIHLLPRPIPRTSHRTETRQIRPTKPRHPQHRLENQPRYNNHCRSTWSHTRTLQKLTDLKIPKSSIKKLMKDIHHNAIKYLTYLVLNKRKLDNKQAPVPPP